MVITIPLLLLHNSLKLSVCKLHQLKGFSVLLSYIFTILQTVKVELKMEHFLIFWVIVKANDRYTVVKLESK